MSVFSTTDIIKEIREYQEKESLLKEKSHHFVFDCPLDFSISCKPDFIWIGVNPGNDKKDWERTNGFNDEETRDRDFQETCGRSPLSKTRKTKIKNFLGKNIFDKTTHTELFFWCSENTGKDFQKRYGTKFEESPHIEFCIKMNQKLIKRVQPRAIFFESLSKIKILERFFNIEKVNSHYSETRSVDEYLIDDKYRLLNFDHLSSGPPASLERKQVSDIVKKLIEI